MNERAGNELLRIDVGPHDHHHVVALSGELDLSTAEQLRSVLTDLVAGEQPPHVVVDLTGLSFMDSTGLGVLVATHRHATSADGSFAVVCGPGPVLRVISITGLVQVLNVHDTLDAATSSSTRRTDPAP